MKRPRLKDTEGRTICSTAGLKLCTPCKDPQPNGCDPCPTWIDCETEEYCLTIYGLQTSDGVGPIDVRFHLIRFCPWIGCPGENAIFIGYLEYGDDPLGACGCGVMPGVTALIECSSHPTCAFNGYTNQWLLFLNIGCCDLYSVLPPAIRGVYIGQTSCESLVFNVEDAISPLQGCGQTFTQAIMTPARCAPGIMPDPGGDCGPPNDNQPPPPDWARACCPDKVRFVSTVDATVIGADAGSPFEPGCSCLTGTMIFHFLPNVNFRNWIGSSKPGYQGSIGFFPNCATEPGFEGYTNIEVVVYCIDGVNWGAIAKFIAPLSEADDFPDIEIGTILDPPCTGGEETDNAFSIGLIMNPGTSCFDGCPCFGGASIVAGG